MSNFVDTQAPLDEQNQDSQEYIEAMVAKAKAARGEVEESNTESSENSDTDKLLAGKYKTEDELNRGILELIKRNNPDLESYYKDLEKGLGKPKADTKPELTVPDAPTPEAEVVEKAGLDMNVLFTEYEQTGSLKDESYAALEKVGITRDVVDSYIAGQEALATQRANQIFSEVGGPEVYQTMIEWAADNLSASEKELFNQTVISNDISQVMFAVEGLKGKYTKAMGNPPQQIVQGSLPDTNSDTFKSRAELVAAMADPRYEKDTAYRNELYNKLQRSNLFNHR